MRTIQMTIDEKLLTEVDQMVDELQTTRSAFIREALERSINYYHIRKLEELDAAGYARQPANIDEVDEANQAILFALGIDPQDIIRETTTIR